MIRIIDFHNHLGSASDAAQTADEIIADMDRYGVERAVVTPINESESDPSYQPQHERMVADTARYKGRLIGFLRLKAARKRDAKRELARMGVYGFRGIKLHPLSDGFKPRDAYFALDAAGALGIPVLVHCSHNRHCTPKEWENAALDFPATTIVLAHSGRSHIEDAIFAAKKCPNLMLDTSINIWFNLRLAARELPAERFVFASDTPYSHRSLDLASVKLIWGESDLTKVLAGNAMRLLGEAK